MVVIFIEMTSSIFAANLVMGETMSDFKICEKTGQIYSDPVFDVVTWLLNVSFHEGAPIESMPMHAIFSMGFHGQEYLN